VTTTNGRDQATAILSGTDALVAAAEAAKEAKDKYDTANTCETNSDYRDFLGMAASLAGIAEGLSVYAATVGKWAAR
jgi:hypothetical protein